LLKIIYANNTLLSTYGHSQLKTGHPVRSAIHKQLNGRLVRNPCCCTFCIFAFLFYWYSTYQCKESVRCHLF
ncbi:hypothetical protein KCU85_g8386, partial [Aureobasidium melanogenum]